MARNHDRLTAYDRLVLQALDERLAAGGPWDAPICVDADAGEEEDVLVAACRLGHLDCVHAMLEVAPTPAPQMAERAGAADGRTRERSTSTAAG